MPQDKTIVAAFDFDGTISGTHTFLPFLLHAFGRKSVYKELAYSLIDILRRNDDKSIRNRFKASLVRRLFMGKPRQPLEMIAQDYARLILGSWVRAQALERIRWHKAQGHRCIMVSASLDIYLQPVALALGFDDLLCTRLAWSGNTFNGELIGACCRRAEKVNLLTELLGSLSDYQIYAYGNSSDDRELLEVATERFFRPFSG